MNLQYTPWQPGMSSITVLEAEAWAIPGLETKSIHEVLPHKPDIEQRQSFLYVVCVTSKLTVKTCLRKIKIYRIHGWSLVILQEHSDPNAPPPPARQGPHYYHI